MKLPDHDIGNLLGKVEIAQVGRGLVGIEAGNYAKGIIIEHARHGPVRGLRIGIGNHVEQPGIGMPSLRENPVKRAQGKLARAVQLQHRSRLQISRDAHGIPVHIYRLVYIRSWPLPPRLVHLLFGGIQNGMHLLRSFFNSLADVFDAGSPVQHVLGMVVVLLRGGLLGSPSRSR